MGKPPVAQTVLGRAMNTAPNDAGSLDEPLVDSESVASHERQSLLRHSTGDSRILSQGQDKTGSTTRAGIRDVTEAEEIWGELEDDAGVFLPPSAVGHASPTKMFGGVYSDGEGGIRDSTALARSKRGRIRAEQRRGSMPAPYRTEPESSSRPKFRDSRSQKPPMNWWRWQWWRRRSEDGTL